MSDNPLIAKAMEQIDFHDAESARLRRWINEADRLEGREPRFEIDGLEVGSLSDLRAASKAAAKRWQAGEFFNKPFSTAVRQVLLDRYAHVGINQPSPASVDEIHEALTQGSFNFETSGMDSQKNAIRISLGKNSTTFVKLPGSDLFGLVEWYGKRPSKPGRKANGSTSAAAQDLGLLDGEEEAAGSAAAPEATQTAEDRKQE